MKISRFACACLVSALFPHPAAFADYVVLESSAADVHPGDIVAEPGRLSVNPGELVVLVAENGTTLRLDGSGTDPERPPSRESDLRLMLSNLLDHTRDEHISLGGTRGASKVAIRGATPPWKIDPFSSGVQCIDGSRAPEVYRGQSDEPLSLAVRRVGSDESGRLEWTANQQIASWPENLAVNDRDRYAINREGYIEGSLVELRLVPQSVTANSVASIAWLAATQCQAQAEQLLQSLVEEDAAL